MIPNEQNTVTVEKRMVGTRVEMGIAEYAKAHVMKQLAGLYSDPILAVIREISTNAWDAHVAAGNTAPIEVTLPGALAPFLTIKDYGVGLSVDDIINVYSQYGASTKRESNDFNGTLGFGCKAPFAYSPQFTVTSVKDGARVTVDVMREEDGSGDMTITDTRSTNEPNGTTVMVPVKRDDMALFEARAKEFYSFWEPGTVLVGCVPPRHFTEDALKLTETAWAVQGWGMDKIVMGNVAYPIPSHETKHDLNGYSVVAFVPIGTVDFPPARESLEWNSRTRQAVVRTHRDAMKGVSAAIQRKIDEATTPIEAIIAANTWSNVLRRPYGAPRPKFQWRGKDFPKPYALADDSTGQYNNPVRSFSPRSGYRTRLSSQLSLDYVTWPETHWVVGYELSKFTPTHRKKLEKFYADKGMTLPMTVAFVPNGKRIPYEWIDRSKQVHKWEDINAVKLPRPTRSVFSNRIAGSYDLYKFDGVTTIHRYGVPGDEIDQDGPTFYTCDNRRGTAYYTHIGLEKLYPNGYTLVYFPHTREAKFERNFPKARALREALVEKRDAWAKTVPERVKLALYIEDVDLRGEFRLIVPSRVDDPALKEAAKLARISIGETQTTADQFAGLTGDSGLVYPEWANPLDNYPLFSERKLLDHPDHVYMYLNAAYAAETKEG